MNQKANILIVDDEKVIGSLFTDLLSEEGCEVTCAENGKEAIERVKEKHFQIAFIDVHMPLMNGALTVRAIRELSPSTEMVMMDSFPDIFLEQALKEGIITCVHKPFNIQEIIEIVTEILEKRQKV
jgi:DNA-binding NtrC family response regulator